MTRRFVRSRWSASRSDRYLPYLLGVAPIAGCEEKPKPRTPTTEYHYELPPPSKRRRPDADDYLEPAPIEENLLTSSVPPDPPAPVASAIEPGTGWFCFHAGPLADLGSRSGCTRTKKACDELRAAIAKEGPSPNACKPQLKGVCLTYRPNTDGPVKSECRETLDQCTAAAEQHKKSDHTAVSACQDFS